MKKYILKSKDKHLGVLAKHEINIRYFVQNDSV